VEGVEEQMEEIDVLNDENNKMTKGVPLLFRTKCALLLRHCRNPQQPCRRFTIMATQGVLSLPVVLLTIFVISMVVVVRIPSSLSSPPMMLSNIHDHDTAVELFRTFMLNPPVPPSVPYSKNIQDGTGTTPYFSQLDQDRQVDAFLNGQRGGFFVEVGAYDGVTMSNSLFFEKSRNWTGLLIEANPRAYRELLATDRKALSTSACISLSGHVEIGVDFLAHGMIGGYGKDRFNTTLNTTKGRKLGKDKLTNPYVYSVKANCFPLNVMMEAVEVDRIDMFSLDVEGAELDVLKSIDWDGGGLMIRLLIIEHNGVAKQIDAFLVGRGYRKVEKIDGHAPKFLSSDVMYVLESEFPSSEE